MDIFEILKNTVKNSYALAQKPKHLLLGLSGGADSISLAKLLKDLRENLGFELSCVHVNHGLRKNADEDEQFAAEFCQKLGLLLTIKHVSVSSKGNLEANAREARYLAFYEAKAETQADCLVLAHHMDDQIETVFMRLMYGAGPTGLAAMREYSNGIWRPLLHIRRSELITYLKCHSISWREDESNRDTRFLRNAIRHKLLPVLEELSPVSIVNIAKTSLIFSDEEDYWNSFSLDWLYQRASLNSSNTFLNLYDFDTLHIAAKRRILRSFCFVLDLKLDMNQVERLVWLAEGSMQNSINLPQSVKAFRSAERLHLILPKKKLLNLGSVQETNCEKLGDRRIEAFDAKDLVKAIVRYRLPGDRITPLGMSGSQSLNKYLIDRKMDRPFRDHWPLLAIEGEVLWVIGFGIAQTAAITHETKHIDKLAYIGHLPDETEMDKRRNQINE